MRIKNDELERMRVKNRDNERDMEVVVNESKVKIISWFRKIKDVF